MAERQTRKARPPLPGRQDGPLSPEEIAAMIRVDHAGEFGALRIYDGQRAVLGHDARAGAELAAIEQMTAQEQHHFDVFDSMVKTRAVRPTALEPLWRVAGYALGAATALMGEKAAMACTVAVEDAIDDHYARQIARLTQAGAEPELRETVTRFRGEECEHRDTALAHGAEQAPGYGFLSSAIRLGCRVAIALSERL